MTNQLLDKRKPWQIPGANYGTFSPGAQQIMNPMLAPSPFASGPKFPGIPSVGGGVMQPPQMGGGESSAPQERKGILPTIGGIIQDYGPLALAGLSAYEGIQSGRKQDKMIERAIAAEEERKRMVAEGRERRRSMPESDYSDLYDDPGNVYRKRKIPSVGGL